MARLEANTSIVLQYLLKEISSTVYLADLHIPLTHPNLPTRINIVIGSPNPTLHTSIFYTLLYYLYIILQCLFNEISSAIYLAVLRIPFTYPNPNCPQDSG